MSSADEDESSSDGVTVLASGTMSLGQLMSEHALDDTRVLLDAFLQWSSSQHATMAVPGLRNSYALKSYQVLATCWLLTREAQPLHGVAGGLLTLLPGLGKTLIALCLAALDPPATWPTLVVVPHTVMYEWRVNVEKFFAAADLPVLWFESNRMGGAAHMGAVTAEQALRYRLVVTTYPTLRRAYELAEMASACTLYQKDQLVGLRQSTPSTSGDALRTCCGLQILYGLSWHRVIFDEIQCVANSSTQLFATCAAVPAQRRTGLSGMPLRNDCNDLHAQLFVLGMQTPRVTSAQRRPFVFRAVAPSTHAQWQLCVNKLMLMINYEQAGVSMPLLHGCMVHPIVLGDDERCVYEHFARHARRAYHVFAEKRTTFATVLERIMRARQACLAAYLTRDKSTSPRTNTAAPPKKRLALENKDALDDERQRWCHRRSGAAGLRSSKLRATARLVRQVVGDGHKVVVYSSFVQALVLLRDVLETGFDGDPPKEAPVAVTTTTTTTVAQARPYVRRVGRISCCTVVGETPTLERDAQLDQFRTSTTHHCLLATLKVASAGLTLVEATHIVFLDPWWCYEQHWQAVFRAWRIGQTRDVHVHWMIAVDTIEERVLDVCSRKIAMTNEMLGSGSGGTSAHRMADWPAHMLATIARDYGLASTTGASAAATSSSFGSNDTNDEEERAVRHVLFAT